MKRKDLMDKIEEIKKGNSKLATHTIEIECDRSTDYTCGLRYMNGKIFDLWTGHYLDKDLTLEEKNARADRVPKKRFYVAERKHL